MITCRKCGTEFSATVTIAGKTRSLYKRVFCLTCSPFGGGNRRQLDNPIYADNMLCVCSVCGKQYKYCRKRGHTMSRCSSCYSRQRNQRRKQRAIAYLGGKCCCCSYADCPAALAFHHLDPAKKSFTLSTSWMRSWRSLQLELDKCVLVCCRCHAEITAGFRQLDVGAVTQG